MPNKRISDLGSYISRCCAGQTSRGKEIVANYGDAEPFTNFDASTLWATARMLGSKELEDLAVFSLWDGKKFKKVTLIPFLMVSGVHAHEDIDGEWKPALEEKGYKVDVRFHGLGENAKVRTLILKHLAEAMK